VTAGEETSATEKTPKEDVLDREIREALSQFRRPVDGLFLSALSAGLDIGYGPMLMAVLLSVVGLSFESPVLGELLLANAYSIGFVFVVLGQSELFTEHTTLAVLPVLDGRATLAELGRVWGVVYVGNLVGAVAFAALVSQVLPAMGLVDPEAFTDIARTLVEYDWLVLVGAGVLAGWLMGLLSWLVTTVQESTARLAVVWLVASAIGLAHLPHSIAGSVEVLAGVFAGSAVDVADYAKFLVGSTVGNVVGGSVFVALLNYGHVVRSDPGPGEFEGPDERL